MYNVHLTHSLLCFEFVEFTLIKNEELRSKKATDAGNGFNF